VTQAAAELLADLIGESCAQTNSAAKMVNTSNDKAVGELYASSEEVEALKAKLETFMQEQDIHNKTISFPREAPQAS
jgi:hypothetical protein